MAFYRTPPESVRPKLSRVHTHARVRADVKRAIIEAGWVVLSFEDKPAGAPDLAAFCPVTGRVERIAVRAAAPYKPKREKVRERMRIPNLRSIEHTDLIALVDDRDGTVWWLDAKTRTAAAIDA